MGLLPTREPNDRLILSQIPFLKDAPRSALRAAQKDAVHYSIPGGGPLFLTSDPSDSIYFVLSGSLGAFKDTPDGRTEFIGHIRAGEPVGEMSLISGEPHLNSVYALRDSEIVQLSRRSFMKLMRSDNAIMEKLTRIIMLRMRQNSRHTPKGAAPKMFALWSTSPSIDLDLRARALADALKAMGLRVAIADEGDGERNARFFDDLEARHDIVLLKAAISDVGWLRQTARYADRVWVFARADAHPSKPLMPLDEKSPASQFKLIDLVLLHQDKRKRGASAQEWMDAAGASRIFHWDRTNNHECERLARIIAGRSVGLVLSGGGARAYAHIGAVRALRELGCPFDFLGGSSMGAVIAACVAMGWSDDDIDDRIRRAFVNSNPLGDHHLPVVSLVQGKRVDKRLKEHFGDVEIENIRVPFFAVSTNLTSGSFLVHRRGKVREALRASIALPGILPPIVQGRDILVDGAVLNNFPADVMRESHRGRIIGVDVARAPDGLNPMDFKDPPGFLEWTLENGFSAAPPIASLLMRAATINVDPNAGGELTDLLITPSIDGIELRDWRRYDEVVEAGYLATRQAVSQLTGPLAWQMEKMRPVPSTAKEL